MAITFNIGKVGTSDGPCSLDCDHTICETLREMADEPCLRCHEPLGFGNDYVGEYDRQADHGKGRIGHTHFRCIAAPPKKIREHFKLTRKVITYDERTTQGAAQTSPDTQTDLFKKINNKTNVKEKRRAPRF